MNKMAHPGLAYLLLLLLLRLGLSCCVEFANDFSSTNSSLLHAAKLAGLGHEASATLDLPSVHIGSLVDAAIASNAGMTMEPGDLPLPPEPSGVSARQDGIKAEIRDLHLRQRHIYDEREMNLPERGSEMPPTASDVSEDRLGSGVTSQRRQSAQPVGQRSRSSLFHPSSYRVTYIHTYCR